MMFTPESEILKVKSDADLEGDQWPEFSLVNTDVRDAATGDVANLLFINEHRPVTVTGRLGNIRQDQLHLLVQRPALKTPSIEISKVIRFAYGEYVDGEFAIWVSGAAGWYKIQPSRSYKPVFETMIEAIKVLYFVADMCSVAGKGRKKAAPSADAVFTKVAQENFLGCRNRNSAALLLSKHRLFLLTSMLAGKENVSWGRMPIFSHLKETFPDDYDTARSSMEGPKERKKLQIETSRPQSRHRTSTSKVRERKERVTAGSDESRALENISSRSSQRMGRQKAPIDSQHVKVLSDRSSTDDTSEADNSDCMSLKPTRGAYKGRGRGKGKGKGKSKSVLRPKGSNISVKGQRRASKSSTAENQSNDEPEDSEATSIELVASTKRKFDNLQGQSSKPRKRNASCDQSSCENDEDALPLEDLPLRYKDDPDASQTHREPELVPIVETASIPSFEANEPGGTWLCRVDGCMHRVYRAASDAGRALVQEHYRAHAVEREEQLEQLIKREERPHFPVSNLLKRIREMAEMQPLLHAQVAQMSFPAPLARRY